MWSRLAADAALVLHLAFIAFALFGAVLALRWKWVPLVQLPAAAWGIYVELTGRLCPLTHLENHFRTLAGQGGYSESFVERYLLSIVYPEGLTREVQLYLAAIVIVVNVAIYGLIGFRRTRR
ncbi:MAG TPA: DUF2784 domain-containing protein [Ideonella sp.]|uniref:DUF2784 domain-containing protein n=1 Tax=Ideonella sp. TaxID=1929293 RepID=UPI002E30564B|nr:DUF2784 domain-containing protein [Ideonella sp.]HEX5684184.1 DUF2784 domain-containing protein [Ideonella sp.]